MKLIFTLILCGLACAVQAQFGFNNVAVVGSFSATTTSGGGSCGTLVSTFGNSGSSTPIGNSSGYTWVASSNYWTSASPVCRVDIRLLETGTSGNTLDCYIYSNNAGNPGTLLATSTSTIGTADVGASEGWVTVNFAGYTPTANTGYWTVLKSSGVDASNYYSLRVDSGGVGGATFISANGVTWAAEWNTRGGYLSTYTSP